MVFPQTHDQIAHLWLTKPCSRPLIAPFACQLLASCSIPDAALCGTNPVPHGRDIDAGFSLQKLRCD
jgi:hypothetical protein